MTWIEPKPLVISNRQFLIALVLVVVAIGLFALLVYNL